MTEQCEDGPDNLAFDDTTRTVTVRRSVTYNPPQRGAIFSATVEVALTAPLEFGEKPDAAIERVDQLVRASVVAKVAEALDAMGTEFSLDVACRAVGETGAPVSRPAAPAVGPTTGPRRRGSPA